MKSLNFRDYVLHPIGYRIGLDPARANFDDSQARAIGNYINAYIRRTWIAQDWAEWSTVIAVTPIDHVVPYSFDVIENNVVVTKEIGKVLQVYLTDPTKSGDDFPNDLPFTELTDGIHIGFDHGTTVWIKHLPQPPIFTADLWDVNRSYSKNDVVYKPDTGECYKSNTFNNKGHDPAPATEHSFQMENITEFAPGSPGTDALPKIMQVQLTRRDNVDVPPVPPTGSALTVTVRDVDGVILANVSENGDGSLTLADILALLAADLAADSDLASFTIQTNPSTLRINLQDASDFTVEGTYVPSGVAEFALVTRVVQSFIDSGLATAATDQVVKVTLTNQDVLAGATYSMEFIDSVGVHHIASYVAISDDGPTQILQGLARAVQTGGEVDDTLGGINFRLDESTNSMLVGSSQPFAINTLMEPQGSVWWLMVPFPFELIDPIICGATADVLKEWGQYQIGEAEEQALPHEVGMRSQVSRGQQFEPLESRGGRRSRYALK